MLWRRDGTGAPMVVRCLCKSWRCDGCAWSVARSDYRRIEHAATSRRDWLYCVLTLDPKAHRDRWHAFRAGGEHWDNRLRERLQRAYGKLEYVQTWESHRSGWPHVNVLVRSSALLAHVRELGVEKRTAKGAHGERCALFPFWRRELARIAPECGFGLRVWAELIEPRSAASMSAYLCKVAGELTRAHVKAGDQRPTEAPRGFRRLRASRKLLPARRASSGEWTGFLAKRQLETFANRETGEIAITMDDVERLWIEHTTNAGREWYRRWMDPADELVRPDE